jgi:phage terminase large subunit-like protein
MQRYCIVPVGIGHGKPLVVHQFQRDHLEEVLASGITSAMTSIPRGNGKSTLSAGVGAWAVFDWDDYGTPQVPIVSVTLGQSSRAVWGTLQHMVAKSPQLARRSVLYKGVNQPRIEVAFNGGQSYPIANDIDNLQGGAHSLALVDEIGFLKPGVWSSMVLATGKRRRSLVWGLGTPGIGRDNSLWTVRAELLKNGPIPGLLYREFAAPAGCEITDRRAWRIGNPAVGAGFLRMDSFETELRSVTEAEFRLFRLGQWVEGINSWLGLNGGAIWDGLQDPYTIPDGSRVFLGLDVGIEFDSTALVMVAPRGGDDPRLHAALWLWTPTKEDTVDLRLVTAQIRELAKTYEVAAVAYDPAQFRQEARELEEARIPMVLVPQTGMGKMAQIIGSLRARILQGRLSHDADPQFTEQILNAVPHGGAGNGAFTLKKGRGRGRIDAATALALACDRAENPPKVRGPVWVG